ncbi:glycoside hydrolase family 3 protein [Streptomyces mirabilis]|uniref:glycoside hydrolase family 3 protein n=1 Tax=Streptomyces mirabilis TaxID=68239 RepID=UPI003663D181
MATEPRWSRQSGTFGSSAELTSELVRTYVRGLQGMRLGPDSVAAMVKRFPGGGPQKDGEDPHFAHGKEQIYPGGMREYHLQPFKAAVEAGCSQVMPYYGQPIGTDWGLLTDAPVLGELFPARAWGAEHLTVAERAAKALNAGSDQFGGEQCPEVIVELVRSGRVTEARIDESLRRLLREKFTLGLFEHPYVDPDRAEETVGAGEFTALGEAAQRRSLTVLTNHELLPLDGRPNLYVRGISEQVAAAYGNVVPDPVDADLAVLRLLDAVPTLVCVSLERPAVLPEIAAKAAALVPDYGASDTALLDVAFGRARAQGRLPFELPHSMAAVEASRPDVPDDTEDPVFPYGHGLNL